MKHFKLAIITTLLFVVGVTLLCVLFIITKKPVANQLVPVAITNNKPTPAATSTADEEIIFPVNVEVLSFPENKLDTSNWQTYRNPKFGFEVQYPKGWRISSSEGKLLPNDPHDLGIWEQLEILEKSGEGGWAFAITAFNKPLREVVRSKLLEKPYCPSSTFEYECKYSIKKYVRIEHSDVEGYILDVKNVNGEWGGDHGLYYFGDDKSTYIIGDEQGGGVYEATPIFEKVILSFRMSKQ